MVREHQMHYDGVDFQKLRTFRIRSHINLQIMQRSGFSDNFSFVATTLSFFIFLLLQEIFFALNVDSIS